MRDLRGQLTSLRMDEGVIPGDGGGPIVEERTGTLIGVAVTPAHGAGNTVGLTLLKSGSAEPIGYLIPAEEVRRTLAGRVGTVDVAIKSIQNGTVDLQVDARLVDPKGTVKAVMVHAGALAGDQPVAPYSDGSWPPLPNSQGVELRHDPDTASASGRVHVLLGGKGAAAEQLFLQTAHRYQSGQLIYSRPRAYNLPGKPGRIYPVGTSLQAIVKAARRESFALLGPLVDPDKDCELKKDGTSYKIQIEIPGDKLHTLDPEILSRLDKTKPLHNAPMCLSDVEGDFAAFVEVTGQISPSLTLPEDRQGNDISATFQGAGLIVYRDRDNFIRLERTASAAVGSFQPSHRVLVEVVQDGKVVASQKQSVAAAQRAYLILMRRKGRRELRREP